jgi:peptide/nickel transport system substrate-binding protein
MSASQSWKGSYTRMSRRRLLATAAAGTAAAGFFAACAGEKADQTGAGLNGRNGAGTEGSSGASSGDYLKGGGIWYQRDNWTLPDESEKAVPGGVLTQAQATDIRNSLDIYLDYDGGNTTSAGRTYEYLVAANSGPGIQPGSAAAREFSPRLAESWEIADAGLTLVWKMRKGVKFHNLDPVNGREMDIEDWKTSDERFMSTSFYNTAMIAVRDHVEFPDGETMVYKMKEPFAEMLNRATNFTHYAILPKELNMNPDLAKTRAVGTGSRVLDRREPSVTIEYSQHPDYWDSLPFIDRWHYPIVPEYSNRYAQFIAKNVYDFALPTPGDVLNIRRDAADSVMYGQEPSQVIFNRLSWGRRNLAESFKDARVRIAIRRAVNWDAIRDFLANKRQFDAEGIALETYTATHIFNDPNYWLDPARGELGDASQNYLFNLEEAKKLMSAAGYPDGVEADGYYGADVQGVGLDRINLTADELNKSGVLRMKLVSVPAAEVVNRVYVENDIEGTLANLAAGGGLDFYLKNFYSTAPGGTQPFKDEALNELVVKQSREIDANARVETLKDIQRYLAKEFYIVPTDGNYGSFNFYWPWLHNIAYNNPLVGPRTHKTWLDPSMPHRNG